MAFIWWIDDHIFAVNHIPFFLLFFSLWNERFDLQEPFFSSHWSKHETLLWADSSGCRNWNGYCWPYFDFCCAKSFYTLTSSKPIDFNPFPWFHIELLTVSVHSIHISVHGIPIQSVVTWFLLSRRMVHSWEIMFFFSPGNSNHQSWELPRTAQDCHLIIIIYFLINHLQYYRACSTRNVELHEKKWNLKTNKTKEVTNTNVYLI